MSAETCLNALLAIVRGEPVAWHDLRVTPAEFLDTCEHHELSGIAYSHLNRLPAETGWPLQIRDELARRVRDDAVRDMLRREEFEGLMRSFDEHGINALVLKGTALAYTVYETPGARPRLDTDLLIDNDTRSVARDVLERHGYAAPPYCDDLFSQFEMIKTDAFGVTHIVDVHWKISTQAVFADALPYDELLARAVPLPALGPKVMTLCPVDALLVACMHPVMHHRNEERVLWIYDTHRLASILSRDEFDTFEHLAREKKMAGVCARGLRLAHTLFHTAIPAGTIPRLEEAGRFEPSAEYLASERRWHHETLASLRALPRFRDRVRMLRDVLLPSRAYMLAVYGVRGKPLAAWLLPALYVHRNVRGAWRILAGKK